MANWHYGKKEQTPGQTYDKDNIFTVKAGKKYNNYKKIQEGREDTEIYPTLEKYGCIDRMIVKEADVYEDMRGIKDLRNTMDQLKAAEKIWQNLPVDVRREFNHSKREFLERGEKWAKTKVNEQKAKLKAQSTPLEKDQTVKTEVKADE